MKTKTILNIILYTVFFIGFWGAGSLVLDEISQHDICPKILGIPACYIILTCFIVPFFVHVFNKPVRFYYLFVGLAFSIALVASVLEILDLAECPRATNGIPMCYYSLALFTSLIGLKWQLNRLV